MTVFYLVLGLVALSFLSGFLGYSLIKVKRELRESIDTWKKERNELKGKIDEQRRIINNMETGDSVVDFHNSVDLLHQYASKK